MSARVTSKLLASALIRRVQAAGGHAAILGKGDEVAGAILLVCMERGEFRSLIERMPTLDRGLQWQPVGPSAGAEPSEIEAYLARRRARDPDLWLIELDVAQAERFAAETTGEG